MRYYLISLMIIVSGCKAQEKDCTKFKIGTFKYNHPDYENHIIIRNDSLQIEVNDKNDIEIITSIEWISDCEYNLVYKDILNYPKKDEVIGKIINVKIIESKEQSYICRIKSYTSDSTMEIIKLE